MVGQDTICAVATAPGKSGVAVIRISGPATCQILSVLTGRREFRPRHMYICDIADPVEQDVLDKGLVVYFPAPHSFTGEACGELHLHGSPAVLSGLISVLTGQGLARLAEPGEFTRRAFHNGKLDLTEVEGLADLIDAETRSQRRQALQQMGGALHRLYGGWRARLVEAAAHLEAAIDFPDEDVPGGVVDHGLSVCPFSRCGHGASS